MSLDTNISSLRHVVSSSRIDEECILALVGTKWLLGDATTRRSNLISIALKAARDVDVNSRI